MELKLCITEHEIKECNSSDCVDCANITDNETITTVARITDGALVDLVGDRIDTLLKLQDLAHKLSEINQSGRFGKSVRNSLADIEMNTHKLLGESFCADIIIYFNLLFDNMMNKSEEKSE